jgi:hypothetical protein
VNEGTVLAELCSIGFINGTVDLAQDDTVCIFGKKSRYSKGFVKHVGIERIVEYGAGRKALLTDQLRIVAQPPNIRFARSGDSGSLVVVARQRNLAGALLVAAEPTAAYATPITRVLGRLGIELEISEGTA